MKVISKPNTKWQYKFSCKHCFCELEANTADLKHLGYAGTIQGDYEEPATDEYFLTCSECGTRHTVPENLIPAVVQYVVPKHNH
jgi:hypothetical protein